MDKIINILLLTIIFVFDPLAIALVIAANFAFEQLRIKTKENDYGEQVPEKVIMDLLDDEEPVVVEEENIEEEKLFEKPQEPKKYLRYRDIIENK